METILKLVTDRPLGFIGAVVALIGIGYALSGNIFGWLGLVVGVGLAFVSEKG